MSQNYGTTADATRDNKAKLGKEIMERKFLEDLGLEKEIIDKVLNQHSAEIGKLKEKAETAETEKNGIKTQLDEANTQIESFKGLDVDGIKAAADEWKTKYETAEAEGKKKLDELVYNHTLDAALAAAKVKNTKAVKALLDNDALKLNGEEIIGLKEQIESLKEKEGYLFEGAQAAPEVVRGGTGSGTGGANAITQDVFNANKNNPSWINQNWESVSNALTQGKLK